MPLKSNTVLAITGPTASGKTALSIAIAMHDSIHAEIISADSRQLFKGLDIGTAKPTSKELDAVPHHFIDICEPEESYNAGLFAKQGHAIITSLLEQQIVPIVVGGSGLYVQALCEGFFDMSPDFEQELILAREEVQRIYETLGRDALFEALRLVDPQSCEEYSDKNPRRIMRALEFHKATGKRFSEEKSAMMTYPSFQTKYVMIEHEREELYQRINDRCDAMWDGMLAETQNMLDRGINPKAQSLDTVGYSQAISFLNGEIDQKTAIEQMKQATRNYAKRQITWSKRIEGLNILKGNIDEMALQAMKILSADA
ncbi:MAG: tRNA (adenosine(37)-N6)-dimethylallyltransferase MiaA [Bacteroidota bacterium]